MRIARRPLPRSFYERDTLVVARDLLGKRIVRSSSAGRRAARIVEVEAYKGPEDRASHARFGPTKRAAIMFGPSGVAYVYLIYGMHHCLNVVAHDEGEVGAVLVRAVVLEEGGRIPADGPGKLTRALSIDRTLNGADLVRGRELWIEDSGSVARVIEATSRVGVSYAGEEWARKPWRLVVRPPL
jgi:DNA-3-methyladenine glycosylase